MTKWEYRIEIAEHLSGKLMASLGQNGWELVTAADDPAEGGHRTLYFKRPIEEPVAYDPGYDPRMRS